MTKHHQHNNNKMELICTIQSYHWGKKGKSSLVGQLASANSGTHVDFNQNFAEFWMGTHSNGPSHIKSSKTELLKHLQSHPHELGPKVLDIFGNQLPFLFKILSIAEPLSIQAHPTKAHAKCLFEKYPNLYKDDNHKPELAIAISKFETLCGFRPLSEIKYFLKNIPEFALLIEQEKINKFIQVPEENKEENIKLMKSCFQDLMFCEKEKVTFALVTLFSRLESLSSSETEKYLLSLIKKINSSFPNDVGILCVYWLNYLILFPGEALYLAPNEPHAYLYGDCLECMANSDNVVRAGLTPKFRDVSTLCEMLTYENHKPSDILFKPVKEDNYTELYAPQVNDFAVAKIVLPENFEYCLKKRESASILIVLEGQGQLNSVSLEFGKVFYIPSMMDVTIKSNGVVLYQAFCNI